MRSRKGKESGRLWTCADSLLLCLEEFLWLEYFFTINDGGNEIGLSDLLNVVVQEIAVEDCHVGYLADLDRTQTVLLTELTGYIDGHGTQRLLAGDGFLEITRLDTINSHESCWNSTLLCRINAELDVHHRRYGIVGVEYHVGSGIIE